MELASKPEKAFSSQMRPLNDTEIDGVNGGVVWMVPLVIAIAVATYLASQKAQ